MSELSLKDLNKLRTREERSKYLKDNRREVRIVINIMKGLCARGALGKKATMLFESIFNKKNPWILVQFVWQCKLSSENQEFKDFLDRFLVCHEQYGMVRNIIHRARQEPSDGYDKKYEPKPLISRNDAEEYLEYVTELLDGKFKIRLAGSYLRGKRNLGDVDMIIYMNKRIDIREIYNKLIKDERTKQFKRVDNVFKLEFTSAINSIIHADIVLTIPSTNGACELYITGSKHFNIYTRKMAKLTGIKVSNSYVTLKDGSRLDAENERTILDAIGISYVHPSLRF